MKRNNCPKKMIAYYLQNLGLDNSSRQAKDLREIVLSSKPEPERIMEFQKFVLSQDTLFPDTASLINRALMPAYGAEYFGLCGDDFLSKSVIYKQIIDKFVEEPGFKFYYADCCLMAGIPVAEIYPILKEGILQDKERRNYPTSDLFEAIHESDFSFDFDMLVLVRYYQPCEQEAFDEYVADFKEQYKDKDQQHYLNELKWKGFSSTE
ncbi:hypothetical protein ACTHGU_02970 [Chitinophagaceae bacterium MMS25-I14]